jgi:hypothetical protein
VVIARIRQDKSRAKAAAREKAEKKKRAKASRAAVRELRRNTLSWQHNLTQEAFNRMRVLQELLWFQERGLPPTCISCGKPNMDWCCGHFITRGSNGRTRYDPRNTYLQCNRYCNMALSGNRGGNKTTHGYDEGLRIRFGIKEGNAIIQYCESQNDPKKWDCMEVEQMRFRFKKEIRNLERQLSL